MLERSSVRYVITLHILDVVLTLIALPLARALRLAVPLGRPIEVVGSSLPWPIFVLAALTWMVVLSSSHLYEPARLEKPSVEFQSLVAGTAVAMLVFAGLLYFSYRGLSRLLYVYFYLVDVALCGGARLVLRHLMDSHRNGLVRVVIAGAGETGQQVARALVAKAWMGLEVTGFLDDRLYPGEALGLPILGTLDDASEIMKSHGIQELVVALPMTAHHRLSELVESLSDLGVNIKAVPDYSDVVFLRTTVEDLGGLFLIGLREPVLQPVDRIVKRMFDIIVSILGLLILSPLFLALALAVKLTSPGPVLYKSMRVGEGGEIFDMLKFRTMVQGADKYEEELVTEDDQGRLLFEKRADDPRITSVGRFLRRFSLDELPQLWNVFIGQMSLVGPRPELPSLVAHYESWQRKRFAVPQGITGWWQVSGRSDKPKYLHVEDDLYYIRNYSLWLDVQIILRTFGAVLKRDGAY